MKKVNDIMKSESGNYIFKERSPHTLWEGRRTQGRHHSELLQRSAMKICNVYHMYMYLLCILFIQHVTQGVQMLGRYTIPCMQEDSGSYRRSRDACKTSGWTASAWKKVKILGNAFRSREIYFFPFLFSHDCNWPHQLGKRFELLGKPNSLELGKNVNKVGIKPGAAD